MAIKVLLERIKFKDSLLKKAKRTKRAHDWEQARKTRNAVNTQVRKAKADFIKNKLLTHAGDHKKFWHDIKEVIPDSTSNTKISLKNTATDAMVTEADTPNFINNFFINAGKLLAENLIGT